MEEAGAPPEHAEAGLEKTKELSEFLNKTNNEEGFKSFGTASKPVSKPSMDDKSTQYQY